MPVVNRVERKFFGAIGLGDVSAALGREIRMTVANEPQSLGSAQDQGLLLGAVKPKSAFVADIQSLAEAVSSRGTLGDRK